MWPDASRLELASKSTLLMPVISDTCVQASEGCEHNAGAQPPACTDLNKQLVCTEAVADNICELSDIELKPHADEQDRLSLRMVSLRSIVSMLPGILSLCIMFRRLI